jgi:hypothetical protein
MGESGGIGVYGEYGPRLKDRPALLDPNSPALHLRLSCVDCGAHVLVPHAHNPGGVCSVCASYSLVPWSMAVAPRNSRLPFTASLAS